MKFFLFITVIITGLASCNSSSNDNKNKPVSSDSAKPVTPYSLDVPNGWTTERFPFPINFAPGIPFTGVEDLRFTKGWEDILSDEHWSYAFLWWIDGKPTIEASILQKHLTEYYSGLVQINIQQRNIPAIKIVPTVAAIKQANNMNGDAETYTGTISMLDYIAQEPIVLNCVIHVKSCEIKSHTAILFTISPKPFDHAIWQPLNKLNADFACGN